MPSSLGRAVPPGLLALAFLAATPAAAGPGGGGGGEEPADLTALSLEEELPGAGIRSSPPSR